MNEVFSESAVTREGVFHWADSKTLVIVYMPVSNTVNIEIFGPVAVDKADEVLSLAEFVPLVLVIDVLNRGNYSLNVVHALVVVQAVGVGRAKTQQPFQAGLAVGVEHNFAKKPVFLVFNHHFVINVKCSFTIEQTRNLSFGRPHLD